MNPVNTTVAIDPQIKSKAATRAKRDQLSISAVIRLLLLDYAEGRLSIGARSTFTENGLTPQQEAHLWEVEKEARSGVNVSGPFKDIEAIKAHLQSAS